MIKIVIERDSGAIQFESRVGQISLDLAELALEQKVFDLGGMGLKVRVQRYPENLTLLPLLLEREVALQAGKMNPFLIKAIQEDGQIAWSSPIYVTHEN